MRRKQASAMRLLATLMAVIVLAGCGGPSQTSLSPVPSAAQGRLSPFWPPLLNDFRFHWSAEPGIDIFTGPAVIIRAYMESYDIATFTADISNVYPGFMRATPENQTYREAPELQVTGIRPLGEGYSITSKDARPHYGAVQYHLLEMNSTPDGWDVIGCTGNYANFMESEVVPGKFVSVAAFQPDAQPRPGSGVRPFRITLTQLERGGPAPVSVPQRGPAPAPNQDLFANWFITGASFGGWGPKNAPEPLRWPPASLQQRCSQVMPQSESERLAIITGFKDNPPPHGDAVPGWPLNAS